LKLQGPVSTGTQKTETFCDYSIERGFNAPLVVNLLCFEPLHFSKYYNLFQFQLVESAPDKRRPFKGFILTPVSSKNPIGH